VEIHVLQGERAMAKDNRTIGRFHLDGLPSAPRGVPQIEVTFDIDANGIIHVSAKDKATGKEQNIRIQASSGLSKEDIEKMKREAEMNAESDRAAREQADTINQADTLIFQTEKQMKEFGDKIPADKKEPIESALAELKQAHAEKDVNRCKSAIENLNNVFGAAATDMYNASSEQGQAQSSGNAQGNDSEVTDVDFEEVKDDKK
jgi:molecular chaperone DnaK